MMLYLPGEGTVGTLEDKGFLISSGTNFSLSSSLALQRLENLATSSATCRVESFFIKGLSTISAKGTS